MNNEDFSLHDKVVLRDLALQIALSKLKVLGAITEHLSSAKELCTNWQNCHNTFSNDPTIDTLKDKIRELENSVYGYYTYFDQIFTALTNRSEGEFDYFDGNDVVRLRQAEAESRGIQTKIEEDDIPLLPNEDPIHLYLRLKK